MCANHPLLRIQVACRQLSVVMLAISSLNHVTPVYSFVCPTIALLPEFRKETGNAIQTRARLRAVLSGSLVVLAYSIPGGWLIFVVGHAVFIQLRDDFLLSGVLLLRLRLSELWFCLIDGRLIQTISMTWLRPGVAQPVSALLHTVAGGRILFWSAHTQETWPLHLQHPRFLLSITGAVLVGQLKREYHFLS